jgi:hypothetical protein
MCYLHFVSCYHSTSIQTILYIHSHHILHPFEPHSTSIQKRTNIRRKTEWYSRMKFFWTVCVNCILSHATTLHPFKPHSTSIQKRTNTRCKLCGTPEWSFFFNSMCYLHFVSCYH